MKFDLVVAIFPNLIANDYKLHVVVNGLVTFWLISTSVIDLSLFEDICKMIFWLVLELEICYRVIIY